VKATCENRKLAAKTPRTPRKSIIKRKARPLGSYGITMGMRVFVVAVVNYCSCFSWRPWRLGGYFDTYLT
jgi:hypothetical protein